MAAAPDGGRVRGGQPGHLLRPGRTRRGVQRGARPTRYGAATAANESRANAASILGQPAGTLLYALTRWAPFGFAVLMHVISLVTLLFVRRDLQAPKARADEPGGLLARVREGFVFVWGQLYLRRALGLFAASNILFQVLGLGLVVIVKNQGGSPPTVGHAAGGEQRLRHGRRDDQQLLPGTLGDPPDHHGGQHRLGGADAAARAGTGLAAVASARSSR